MDDAPSVEVGLENETVWLRQQQMAQLFDRDRNVSGRHTRNLFREDELEEESNVQKLHVAGADWLTAFDSLGENSRARCILMKIGRLVEQGKAATPKDLLAVLQRWRLPARVKAVGSR